MKQYLVQLRHTMDDLPLAIFGSRKKALAFAEKVKPMPTNKIRKILATDCSTPVGVNICTFVDGVPTKAETVKCFDY